MNEMFSSYTIGTYKRFPLAFVKGEGAKLWDSEGKEYIDFLSGISVCNIGHCHPKLVEAIQKQAGLLLHTSNLFHILPQEKLAERLYNLTGMLSFFCNSGAEANEAAIKLARAYGKAKGRYKIISALNSFHGRTFGALSATGQKKYQEKFQPLLPGFSYALFNDLSSFASLMDDETCAVILEPVQGEGGIHPATKEFLQGIYKLCRERDILLILDEVQTGLGRCGTMFCYQLYDVVPDIITLAKSLGGGIPIGAMLAKPEVAKAFAPGDHASTFGGNFLATTAALAVLDIIEEEKLCERAQVIGNFFKEKLEELKKIFPCIREIRGIGMMLAVELDSPIAREVVSRALEKGLIINATSDYVIRFLPPLVIKQEEIEKGISILKEVLNELL
ncbi:aspartate aminotransferase family protein [bacterium]|nr:aspartate aminotransferase family protein [bacterium]